MSNQELIEKAHDAMKYAYAPYSHFKVGAAVLTQDGFVYTGCNIENVSFSATNCAERTAVFKAVSEGHGKIKSIAIVSSSGEITPPCGVCRQVLSEFMDKDGIILLSDKNETREIPLSELLPLAFEKFV
jgi:cytidine deaminase